MSDTDTVPWQFDPERPLYEKFERMFAANLAAKLRETKPMLDRDLHPLVRALDAMSKPQLPTLPEFAAGLPESVRRTPEEIEEMRQALRDASDFSDKAGS